MGGKKVVNIENNSPNEPSWWNDQHAQTKNIGTSGRPLIPGT